MPGGVERDTRAGNDIEAFLEVRDNPRPLFLFVNLIGAPSPYDSCAHRAI